MKLRVDLNADLGEGAGFDEQLLALVSSASIACGFHAGDADTIRASISAAKERGVAVGAHPSLFDRENFGRKELPVTAAEVLEGVRYQIGIFQAIAEAVDVRPKHVKPHGALYNMAARDQALADAIARAIFAVDDQLVLFAPPNSALSSAGEAHGLRVAREVFADRNYMPDGSLVPRTHVDALLHDPTQAARRVVRMLRHRSVRAIDGSEVAIQADTICVHGDTPDAVEFARALRHHLASEHIEISAPVWA